VLACSALKPEYRQLLPTAEQPQAGSAAGSANAAVSAVQVADVDTAAAGDVGSLAASSTGDPSSSQHSRIAFVSASSPLSLHASNYALEVVTCLVLTAGAVDAAATHVAHLP
jgi:hypothetical protein